MHLGTGKRAHFEINGGGGGGESGATRKVGSYPCLHIIEYPIFLGQLAKDQFFLPP